MSQEQPIREVETVIIGDGQGWIWTPEQGLKKSEDYIPQGGPFWFLEQQPVVKE